MIIRASRLVALLWIVQVATQTVGTTDSETTLNNVKRACVDKLNFKSIVEFLDFMKDYKSMDVSEWILVNGMKPDEKGDKLMRRCIDERESLLDLEELVINYDRKRACRFIEVAKLEDYARKHLLEKRPPLALKFYTLFGVNIAFRCSVNLLAHVKQADMEVEQLDFIYSMASPAGWNVLINEHTRKSMKFGTSAHEAQVLVNQVAKNIPGLSRIDQLEYLSFNHVYNDELKAVMLANGVEVDGYVAGSVEVAQKLEEYLLQISKSCANLDQFYLNSILSLARLNYLGLLVNFEILAGLQERSQMLHKWLAAASFCQLMVRVKVRRDDDELVMKISHDDDLIESRRKLYSYVADFDEITTEAIKHAWLASVSEAPWAQKSRAIFRPDIELEDSVALKKLNQFVKGVARDHAAWQNAQDR